MSPGIVGHLDRHGSQKRSINVRFETDLLEAIDRAAETEDRTRSDLIFRALTDELVERGLISKGSGSG